MSNRKVCVVVASRMNYARVKYVMKAINAHPKLELQLVAGASTLLERFGKPINIIIEDGFQPLRSIHYVVEGETPTTQAKSTGLGIVELSTAFEDLQPDMVMTVADRFETMATAIASTYLNIPLVHLQGGEISGNLDDRVGHAITKLADFHFVTTEQSRERVIRMGEDPAQVFNFGCPAMDILINEDLNISQEVMARYGGVGRPIDWAKPYVLMVQHPVTTSYGEGLAQITKTLTALHSDSDMQKIVLWPNADAGSDEVSKGLRVFRETYPDAPFHYYKNFTPEDYARVLNNAACCIGNSSSFIREGSFLGVPAVLIGDRQVGREHGSNVLFADYDTADIQSKVAHQLAHGRYEPERRFGQGTAGLAIAQALTQLNLNHTKRITY